MIASLFALIATYLICSIPSGLLMAKFYGAPDLRKNGSGNIGATNAWRIGGKWMGITTFALDVLKGFIPVYLIARGIGLETAYLAVIFAVCGHVFPIWLSFKGGKGVATLIASLMGAIPALGIIMICTWMVAFYHSRIVSLSSTISIVIVWICSFFFYSSIKIFIIVTIASAIVLWRHKDNIERIIEGRELRVK